MTLKSYLSGGINILLVSSNLLSLIVSTQIIKSALKFFLVFGVGQIKSATTIFPSDRKLFDISDY